MKGRGTRVGRRGYGGIATSLIPDWHLYIAYFDTLLLRTPQNKMVGSRVVKHTSETEEENMTNEKYSRAGEISAICK